MANNDKAHHLDLFLKYMNERGAFNGNALIAENNEIIYEKAFGIADFKSGRKLDLNSVFDLASVSKATTAMAIMILKEREIISYQDKLEHFFPEFPYEGITVRNLLNHTSGLPDYLALFFEKWDRSRIAVNKDIIDMLRNYCPAAAFKAGEKFEYSNTGYALLASIVEQVSEISFSEFLKQNIFDPLRMKNTSVINRRKDNTVPPNYAFGYVYSDSSKTFELPDDLPETNYVGYMDGIQGDGAVNSTLSDLYKWDRALYTDRLVKKETLSEAFMPVELLDHSISEYGFGWGIQNNDKGKIVRHAGGWPGYNSFIARYIDFNKTLIFLCNVEQTDDVFRKTIDAIENILFDKDFVIPELEAVSGRGKEC